MMHFASRAAGFWSAILRRPRGVELTVLFSLASLSPAGAGPLGFDLGLSVPPVIVDSQAPVGCTVTWLITDTANGDVFAARMRIAGADPDVPENHRMPCPRSIPPRVAARALDACVNRAADPKSCVYADMIRGFELGPDIQNSAENASRCMSDRASQIGVACWMSGKLSVCNVGCGETPEQAAAHARQRCEDKQQHSCPVTGTVAVSGP
jgi:hypothetical protein